MFELHDLYDDCDNSDAFIMIWPGMPAPAATIRDGECTCIAFDCTKLKTTRELRGAAMHEDGHLQTGCLHKVDSPYQIVAQAEHRADAYSFQRFLTSNEISEAMRNGYTQIWQLAEYFDLPEKTIQKALHYWTECKGIDFNKNTEDNPA